MFYTAVVILNVMFLASMAVLFDYVSVLHALGTQ